jgi:tetratricopeptide (TPR) repeat protein
MFLAQRAVYAALALICASILPLSAVLAQADWFRQHPDAQDIGRTIRMDPLHPYGYTLRAEQFEQSNRFDEAEKSWHEALRRDPRNAEAWIRMALLQEGRGNVRDSEKSLLSAARVDHTWFPRWSLVNFYLRHGRTADAQTWSRLALERASADVTGLFAALTRAGIDVEPLLPANRRVCAAYLEFLISSGSAGARIESAARRLAALIREAPFAWPGAAPTWMPRTDPVQEYETAILLRAVDALLDGRSGQRATGLWNLFHESGIMAGKRWDANAPVVNAQFRATPAGSGLDWRVLQVAGVELRAAPELLVRMGGHQPEAADLVVQRVYLRHGVPFHIAIESRTEDLGDENGLSWHIREKRDAPALASIAVPQSEDWQRSTAVIAAAGVDRILEFVLRFHRVSGTVRPEGAARFRLATLEESL